MGHRVLSAKNPRRFIFCMTLCAFVFLVSGFSPATSDDKKVLLRDITTIAGVRDNPLIGYSIVVGLNGTGDRRQTLFTTQTLANIMQRMGVQIPANQIRVNNI